MICHFHLPPPSRLPALLRALPFFAFRLLIDPIRYFGSSFTAPHSDLPRSLTNFYSHKPLSLLPSSFRTNLAFLPAGSCFDPYSASFFCKPRCPRNVLPNRLPSPRCTLPFLPPFFGEFPPPAFFCGPALSLFFSLSLP